MKLKFSLLLFFTYCSSNIALAQSKHKAIQETKSNSGQYIFEAENFHFQTNDSTRKWLPVFKDKITTIGPDSDTSHVAQASGGVYLEVLPDTRHKDEHQAFAKGCIADKGGAVAVLHYSINFSKKGKYFVWAKCYPTDGDDNTFHVGIDNIWASTGKKLQAIEMNKWAWTNKQRDTKAKIFINVDSVGIHDFQFSMREDGGEIDRFFITNDSTQHPASLINSNSRPKTVKNKNLVTLFEEQNGELKIEAENCLFSNEWELKDSAETKSLKWAVKGQGIKAGKGILTYFFKITTEGNYQFVLKSKIADPNNRPETLDPDGNDIWMKINGGLPVKEQAILKEDWNKIAVLGHPSGWTFNTNLDIFKEHNSSPVTRFFIPGTYTISFSGRSEGYEIDYFLLKKYDTDLMNKNTEASDLTLKNIKNSTHKLIEF
jgi:hypothetical protein